MSNVKIGENPIPPKAEGFLCTGRQH